MRRLAAAAALALLVVPPALADGPADNRAENVRQVPKPGIPISADDRAALDGLAKGLGARIDELRRRIGDPAPGRPATLDRSIVADVEIYRKAARVALDHDEFLAPEDVARAKELIRTGLDRAEAALAGRETRYEAGRPTVLGYVSKIDGSTQPYALVIPEVHAPRQGPGRNRLDIWFHGRGEELTELRFLVQGAKSMGEFHPPETFVLHPYGRFCNAFKFAGEVDVLEALDDVKSRFRIDEDRIAVRGFSMGGAAAWQFAVHYADRWCVANPGAGFAETTRFLRGFQGEKVQPTWYEKALFRLYDCDLVAANLLQCPTVAYSGESDGQKQAADVMAEALRAEGVELTHVIGPKTGHKYEPGAKAIVAETVDALAGLGRSDDGNTVTFATYTLRYPSMSWITVDALEEHWERAEVRFEALDEPEFVVETRNVRALTIAAPAGRLLPLGRRVERLPAAADAPGAPETVALSRRAGLVLQVDGQALVGPPRNSDRSWRCSLHKEGERWALGPLPAPGLRKRHGLQGPIDDAFMDRFLFVRPTGASTHPKVAAWAKAEMDRAVVRWRRQMRGDAPIKDDRDVTEEDIRSSNLVLWGDRDSNAVWTRIAETLPIRGAGDALTVGDRSFAGDHHAPIAIYPNPINPARYVVLNSGFTYREYDDLNNARQVPRLPDWAIVDVDTPPDSRFPGKVVAADFFGERWEVRPPRP